MSYQMYAALSVIVGLILLVVYLGGFNINLKFDNDQSNVYSAIKAKNRRDFLKYHTKLEMTEDEIKEFIEGWSAMPIGWVLGMKDALEEYQKQYRKYMGNSSM